MQREDVSPVRILKDLGIDYIGQCNFVVTFIHLKDGGWLQRGGDDGLDSEVYLFIDSCQLEAAGSYSCNLLISCHVFGRVMQCNAVIRRYGTDMQAHQG